MLFKYFQYKNFSEFDLQILKRNLWMHLGDGAMYAFALSFVSAAIILPVFVQRIGGNAIAIGAVPVLWSLGASLPQIFIGQQKSHEKFVKPAILFYSVIYRSSFLIVGLFIFFFLEYIPAAYSVVLLLTFIVTIAILGSVPGPRWVNLFAKTTPVKLRGRLLAVRQLTGALLGILAGSITIIILSSIRFPQNFAVLFFLCFIFMAISYFLLKEVEEPEEIFSEELVAIKPKKFEKIKRIVTENKNFRNYLFADSLLLVGLTSSAFFAVYAIDRFKLSTSYAGSFTIIFMSSMALGNIIFGYIADIFGHKINLMIMGAAILLANFCAIISINPLTYGCVFFFFAWAQGIQGISRIAFVIELGAEKERTLYSSILNSITAPALVFGIIAGIIISIIGYPIVFFLYMIVSGFAIYWLYKEVEDPRTIKIDN